MAKQTASIVDRTNPAFRHGHAGRGGFSPEYHSWSGMWTRCTNPNRSTWKHYGGKGVTICKRWTKFENFLADMGPRPTGTSLDRIDSNKNYTPANCRWADTKTQNRNSAQVVWVTINGAKKRLVEWCELKGVSINTVRHRVKYHGLTYVQALSTPVQSRPGEKLKPKK